MRRGRRGRALPAQSSGQWHGGHGGRGFALPLVILLTLIVALGLAVLFQRNGVAGLATRRQADNYMTHHAGLGMRELINRWLTTVRGRLKESLDSDGFAFSLDLPDGQRVDVFIEDAQGAALAKSDLLTGRRLEIVELMNAYLDQLPEESLEGARRQHGPSEVSIATAPMSVLTALAAAIVGPEKAPEIAEALTARMEDQDEDGDIGAEQISRALSEAGVEPRQVAEFQAMVATTPVLWRVTAELRSGSGRVLDRAGGLIEISANRLDTFNQNGPFVEWESLSLDELMERE